MIILYTFLKVKLKVNAFVSDRGRKGLMCSVHFFVKVEFIESMEIYMPKDSDNMVVCNKCIEECK